MDNLQEIIHSLDASDCEEFSWFIQRSRFKKDRKDLLLFKLLKEKKKWDTEELIANLNTKNSNAYHTIRKRLFRHLSDFILLKSQSKQENETAQIQANLNTAKFLLDKHLHELGWKYLLSAEEMALQQDAFHILNDIYLLELNYAHLQQKVSLEEIIEKYERNRVLLNVDERFSIVKSVIVRELERYRLSGKEVKFQYLINKILSKYQISQETLQQPRLFLKLLQIIRSGTIATKAFHNFEPFLTSSYKSLFKKEAPQSYGSYQIEMLYMVAHTLYRNKKFPQSLDHLIMLEQALLAGPKSLKKRFWGRVIQMKAANKMFLGHLEEAIQILSDMLVMDYGFQANETNNTIINLGMYHFIRGDYKKTLNLFYHFDHSDNWYKKQMGVEWVFKKNLMEVILYYELNKLDICENRIRSVERSFAALADNPIYKRGFVFLTLVKNYIQNPLSTDIHAKVEEAFEWLPKEQEDIQAMAFYTWLKAKLMKQEYYPVLLELVN
ncbi:hypothetical protein RCC89_10055 [Cytophagaceae bacterium ABcell3]|nr:hypothetical protein RCC89_10055 [Cytophagaceae bacterium ABcell3]